MLIAYPARCCNTNKLGVYSKVEKKRVTMGWKSWTGYVDHLLARVKTWPTATNQFIAYCWIWLGDWACLNLSCCKTVNLFVLSIHSRNSVVPSFQVYFPMRLESLAVSERFVTGHLLSQLAGQVGQIPLSVSEDEQLYRRIIQNKLRALITIERNRMATRPPRNMF